jgi:hypothetical protein
MPGWEFDRVNEGRAVAERYYHDVVRPLLDRTLPGLPHAAARLGTGSEVLGLDDVMSRDHDWGLRLTLVVDAASVLAVEAVLAELPESVDGLPTRFPTSHDAAVRHRVDVTTREELVRAHLGVRDPGELDPRAWLALTGQSVLELTAGPVFADAEGELAELHRELAWYPRDVWLHVLAAGWTRLAEELPFVGRAAIRGDEVGSTVIAARLARTMLHLACVLERRWPPYAKWLGMVVATLPRGAGVLDPLTAALRARDGAAREDGLVAAAELLHAVQRSAGLPTGAGATEPFHGRPFRGVRAEVAGRLRAAIGDPEVRRLPVGAIEQWVDGVEVLTAPERRLRVVEACG